VPEKILKAVGTDSAIIKFGTKMWHVILHPYLFFLMRKEIIPNVKPIFQKALELITCFSSRVMQMDLFAIICLIK